MVSIWILPSQRKLADSSAEEPPQFPLNHYVKKDEDGWLYTLRHFQLLFVDFERAYVNGHLSGTKIPSQVVLRQSELSDKLATGKLRSNISVFGSSSMLDQGVWAEVKVGGEHLRLFSGQSALGVQASVYNVSAKKWIAPSESADDIEQAGSR